VPAEKSVVEFTMAGHGILLEQTARSDFSADREAPPAALGPSQQLLDGRSCARIQSQGLWHATYALAWAGDQPAAAGWVSEGSNV
jgi:hypothetical protein